MAPRRTRMPSQYKPSNSPTDEDAESQPSQRALEIVKAIRRPSGDRESQPTQDNASFPEIRAKGLYALVDAIYDLELKRNHSLAQKHDLPWWRRIGVPFLASIPEQLLTSLISGTLVKDWVDGDYQLAKLFGEPEPDTDSEDDELAATIWQNNSTRNAPGHYVRFLVSPKGDPPTLEELHLVVTALREYVKQSCEPDLARCIDNARARHRSTDRDIDLGNFFFLCSDSNVRARSSSRIVKITEFCVALSSRIERVSKNLYTQPDARALAYVGYALNIQKRIKSHEDGNASSFLMSLIENTMWALKLDYSWETFVTSFAISWEEACLGEVLINGLAQAYHDTGFGVAGHPAGENCDSAKLSKITTASADRTRQEWISFRFNATPYERHMTEEARVARVLEEHAEEAEATRKKRIQEYKDGIRELESKIAQSRQFLEKTAEGSDPIFQKSENLLEEMEACKKELESSLEQIIKTDAGIY